MVCVSKVVERASAPPPAEQFPGLPLDGERLQGLGFRGHFDARGDLDGTASKRDRNPGRE